MNESNDELFESLMKEYQRVDLPSQDLAASVDRGHRRLVRGLAIGTGITVLLCTVGLLKVILHPTPSSFVFAFMQIGFSVTAMAFVLWSQRKSWSSEAVSTRAFLSLELERCRDATRRTAFSLWSVPVLMLLSFLFQALLIHEKPELLPALWPPGVAAATGFGGPYVIAIAILVQSVRKRRRLLQQEADLVRRIVALDEEAISL